MLQIFGEILVECGFHVLGTPFRERRRAHPAVALVGIAVLGGLAGVIANRLLPARLLSPSVLPGLSLLVSPVLCGAVMARYGAWQRARGRQPSSVATFAGGALFAFVMALVRFVGVGR